MTLYLIFSTLYYLFFYYNICMNTLKNNALNKIYNIFMSCLY